MDYYGLFLVFFKWYKRHKLMSIEDCIVNNPVQRVSIEHLANI